MSTCFCESECWQVLNSKKQFMFLQVLREGKTDIITKVTAKLRNAGEKECVSRATLIINYRDELGDPVGLIEDVWTNENFRKQGCASYLITVLIAEAKKHNCYKVNLSCAEHNIEFYKKLGFETYQNNMRINL